MCATATQVMSWSRDHIVPFKSMAATEVEGPLPWLRVHPVRVWSGEEALNELAAYLPPAWLLLLLGDGSPTRNFQMLSGYDCPASPQWPV